MNLNGKADIFSPPGGTPNTAFGFDNYEDIELFSISGKLDFTLNPHVGFGVWYLYEDYTIDSFIRQGLQNYLPGTLLLNANNGDWSAGVSGFWFENGEIVWPVSGVTVAGNLADLWTRLERGSDLEFRGSFNSPSLMFDGVAIAGK